MLICHAFPVQMLGFNRHTLWLDTGAAVTPEQEATDLAILQGLNATYVRCVSRSSARD